MATLSVHGAGKGKILGENKRVVMARGLREKGRFDRDEDRLFGLLLEEGNEVVSVLGLLEATKGHLGAGNVLLGVF